MAQKRHIIARGVIFRGTGEVLLAQARGYTNTFLPGGHLDPGESLSETLVRELAEELGAVAEVQGYLGAVEYQWPEEAPTDYEINHCFLASVAETGELVPREPHLTFRWCPVEQLDAAELEPRPLRELIRRYAGGDRSVWWATNVATVKE